MRQIDLSHFLDSASTVRHGGIFYLADVPFTWTLTNPTPHIWETQIQPLYHILTDFQGSIYVSIFNLKKVFCLFCLRGDVKTGFDLSPTISSPFSNSTSQLSIILNILRVNDSILEPLQATFLMI